MTSSLDNRFDLLVKFHGVEHTFPLPSVDCLVQEVGMLIEERLGVSITTQKLIGQPLKGSLKTGVFEGTVRESGLKSGVRYLLIGSRVEELEEIQSIKDAPRIRNFDEELIREQSKLGNVSKTSKTRTTDGYSFQEFKVLRQNGLHPSPESAEKLLHRLATDPGITGLLQKHKWSVGLLSEMPPEGKVGISQVCVLGYNVNKGQEISLRLRTDDLKGFRKYLSIRKTLIHELTHMVWSDHDENFTKLNSQLLKECDEIVNWEQNGGHTLTGNTAPDPELTHSALGPDGRSTGGQAATLTPIEAARIAAIRRSESKPSN
eukprot:g6206.t1